MDKQAFLKELEGLGEDEVRQRLSRYSEPKQRVAQAWLADIERRRPERREADSLQEARQANRLSAEANELAGCALDQSEEANRIASSARNASWVA